MNTKVTYLLSLFDELVNERILWIFMSLKVKGKYHAILLLLNYIYTILTGDLFKIPQHRGCLNRIEPNSCQCYRFGWNFKFIFAKDTIKIHHHILSLIHI